MLRHYPFPRDSRLPRIAVLSSTFNGCPDAEDDDCLSPLGLTGDARGYFWDISGGDSGQPIPCHRSSPNGNNKPSRDGASWSCSPMWQYFGLDWGWFTVTIGFKHTKTCHTRVRGTILHIEDNGQGSYSPSLPVLMSPNDGSHEPLSEDYIANNNHIKQQSCQLLAILKKARASGGLLWWESKVWGSGLITADLPWDDLGSPCRFVLGLSIPLFHVEFYGTSGVLRGCPGKNMDKKLSITGEHWATYVARSNPAPSARFCNPAAELHCSVDFLSVWLWRLWLWVVWYLVNPKIAG